ncbi:MAG: hypothetical protein WCZ18_11060 [Ottowia sp.]
MCRRIALFLAAVLVLAGASLAQSALAAPPCADLQADAAMQVTPHLPDAPEMSCQERPMQPMSSCAGTAACCAPAGASAAAWLTDPAIGRPAPAFADADHFGSFIPQTAHRPPRLLFSI